MFDSFNPEENKKIILSDSGDVLISGYCVDNKNSTCILCVQILQGGNLKKKTFLFI